MNLLCDESDRATRSTSSCCSSNSMNIILREKIKHIGKRRNNAYTLSRENNLTQELQHSVINAWPRYFHGQKLLREPNKTNSPHFSTLETNEHQRNIFNNVQGGGGGSLKKKAVLYKDKYYSLFESVRFAKMSFVHDCSKGLQYRKLENIRPVILVFTLIPFSTYTGF